MASCPFDLWRRTLAGTRQWSLTQPPANSRRPRPVQGEIGWGSKLLQYSRPGRWPGTRCEQPSVGRHDDRPQVLYLTSRVFVIYGGSPLAVIHMRFETKRFPFPSLACGLAFSDGRHTPQHHTTTPRQQSTCMSLRPSKYILRRFARISRYVCIDIFSPELVQPPRPVRPTPCSSGLGLASAAEIETSIRLLYGGSSLVAQTLTARVPPYTLTPLWVLLRLETEMPSYLLCGDLNTQQQGITHPSFYLCQPTSEAWWCGLQINKLSPSRKWQGERSWHSLGTQLSAEVAIRLRPDCCRSTYNRTCSKINRRYVDK